MCVVVVAALLAVARYVYIRKHRAGAAAAVESETVSNEQDVVVDVVLPVQCAENTPLAVGLEQGSAEVTSTESAPLKTVDAAV